MALTGLQIQKLLPRTNCKECGSNTCLAFAMKLAAKKAELSQCPYASDEAKQVLGAASEPPVKTIGFGAGGAVRTGGETVLYRHEKTFVNQTVLAVNVNDTDPPAQTDATLAAVRDYVLERVGQRLVIDMVAVTQSGGDAAAFSALVKKAAEVTGKPVVMRSADPAALSQAARSVKDSKGIMAAATAATAAQLKSVAESAGHALAVTGDSVDDIVAVTASLRQQNFADLLIMFTTSSPAEQFQTNAIARRAAIRHGVKALGYPFLRFLDRADLLETAVSAVTEINKYGGVCVLPCFNPALLASLMTLRLNIFTDPQKPIQVEPKIYPVGEPKPDSPVFVTTNFSLTYFIVSGEIENSGTSAWLVVPECEGMSVLTAWAAGKFSGASIGKFVKESGLEQQVTTREITIPGFVAQISGELEESLPGWKVLVGPQEAGDIEGYVKSRLIK